MTIKNLAFHNDPELQARIIAQVEGHAAADAKYKIAQGEYYNNGKACFIGCVAHGSSSSVFEQMTGFPVMLTKIGESIFESLPKDQFASFPVDVIKAPKCGADLSLVPWLFLLDTVERAVGRADAKTQAACELALQVLRDKSVGKDVSEDAAADAAAHADAFSTYTSYAYSAVDAVHAVHAAAHAVDAVHAAVRAAASYADVHAARIKQRETYIRLLEQAQ